VIDGQSQRIEVHFDSTSPRHRLLPDRGLGSHLSLGNYATLARRIYHGEELPTALLKNHARNLSHLAEPKQDALLKAVCSDLLQDLKKTYPSDEISDMAARLASEEVRTFRANYPMLTRPKALKQQLVQNVIRRLELLYPQLPRQGRGRNNATPVLGSEVD